jgi:hypothetical protein
MTDDPVVLYFPFFKIGARWIDKVGAVMPKTSAEKE